MITTSTLEFLSNLKANNSKAWFDEHKKEYQDAQTDFLDTVVQLLAVLTSFDADIVASYLDPKACIMRINRDIRFSKDKTPYKTNFFAFINKGGRKSPYAGYYFHVEPGASFVGGGIYMPETPVLEKVRLKINNSFSEWQSIVTHKELLVNFPESVKPSGKLKRPPKGYDSTNPAVDYLKFKGYYTQRFFSDDEVIDPGFVVLLAETFRSVNPLIDFLNRALSH
jgi:uncharacterized protein (TIGR02453 family)